MHSVWSCSSCVAFSIMILFGMEAMASQAEAGLLERDTIHRVPKKPQITPPPQPLRLKRRGDDDLTCPVNHSLCPESLGGGCCPEQYECASDACSATTAALGTACGKTGYYYCPITAGSEFTSFPLKCHSSLLTNEYQRDVVPRAGSVT